MAQRDIGNPPSVSTATSLGTNPSSGTLLAEVTNIYDKQYEVRYIIGASTNGIWRLQHCLSSGFGSTAIVDETVVFTPANQSGEYILNYDRMGSGIWSTDARFRIVSSTGITAQFAVKITAEALV